MVSITDARLLTAAAAAVLAIAFAAPVQAAPLPQDPGCVTPDGAPCPAPPPGCVQDNGMPCTASLPDLNAAIFPSTRRLAIQINGVTKVFDTSGKTPRFQRHRY
jgi:hypothetical protein